VHLLFGFNLAVGGARSIYINDVADLVENTFTDDTIDYTTGNDGIGVGAKEDGTVKVNADIADLWLDDSYIDFTIEANRRLFIDPNGNPVDLGEAGQFPTGSSPIVFLSGATSAWHTNLGTGGGFTENGALTDGGSSPSD